MNIACNPVEVDKPSAGGITASIPEEPTVGIVASVPGEPIGGYVPEEPTGVQPDKDYVLDDPTT